MPAYVILANVGRIVVWGQNTDSQRSDAPKTPDFTEVVPGGRIQSLGIRTDPDKGRTLHLWGGKDPATGNPRPGTVPALTVLNGLRCHDAALGLEHAVAIREDDRTLVMGSAPYSSAAPGTVPARAPVPTPTGQFERVATAGGHGIAIRRDGTLAQWGQGKALNHPAPTGYFMKVRARGDYSLALRMDGVLVGWGGSFDALPDPLWDEWESDGLGHWWLQGPFIDMDAGIVQKDFVRGGQTMSMPHVIAINEGGRAEGWGANSNGETDAPSGVTFKAVATGRGFSVGLDEDGFLYQWGRTWDRIPLSTTAPAAPGATPTGVPRGKFFSISAAGDHAVAVRRAIALVVGPDFRDLVNRQGRMENFAEHMADGELSSALQVVRQAVADWRHAPSATPDDHIRREQQLREFDRLADQVLGRSNLEREKTPV
jgi:alpha-tubulin suppressor-like RCC1 family protein